MSFVSEVRINPWSAIRPKNSSYAELWMNLDRTETHVRIEYPRFPEIMAQVSTVLTGLLTIGIIFTYLNSFFMREQIIKHLKDIFFVDYGEKNIMRKNTISPEGVKKRSQYDFVEK
jgi:pyruvate formate-lyase activating enzyme-like uncharacterized protein